MSLVSSSTNASTSATSTLQLCQIAILQSQLSKAATIPIIRPSLVQRRRVRYQRIVQLLRSVLLPAISRTNLKPKLNVRLFDLLQEFKRPNKQVQLAHQVQQVTRSKRLQDVTLRILKEVCQERQERGRVKNHKA
nr:unnamed protein product [Callosobruchus analis]